MNRLDKYFTRELAWSTLTSTIVAIVVLLALQALRLSRLVINQDLDIGLIIKMVMGLALSFGTLVLPISFVFALLNVFGRMAGEKEFVAMQAMGHSPKRLLKPCLYFGLGVGTLSLIFSLFLSPIGNRTFESSIDEAYKRRVANVLRSGTFSEDFLDMVLFVEEVDGTTNDLKKVFIYDENGFGKESVISADKGKWKIDEKTGVGTLSLEDGVILSEEREKNAVRRISFSNYKVYADFSKRAGYAKNSPPSMGIVTLIENINERVNAGELSKSIRQLWSELARRFIIALACLIFVPLCFTLSLSNLRTAKNRAVMSGILIILSYWTIYFAVMTWYLKTPIAIFNSTQAFAWILISVPNIIAAAVSYVLYRKKLKI